MLFEFLIFVVAYKANIYCQVLNFDGLEAFELLGSKNESLLTNAYFYIANSYVDIEHTIGMSGIVLNESRKTLINH
jgi:hypothetical protein